MTLTTYRPHGLLRKYVRYYWILKCDEASSALTFPIGCPQMIFHKGCPLYIPELAAYQSAFTVSGQVNFPAHLQCQSDTEMIVVVFYPHTAGIFTGTPPSAFYNLEVSGYDLGDKDAEGLASRVFDCEDSSLCLAEIERWLIKRLCDSKDTYNVLRMADAVGHLMTSPHTPVARLADLTCLSRKQFERVFYTSVGMMPKEYARIVRFQRALRMMQLGRRDYACIACESGYSDQSHFIREFKAFSGHTPATLVTECAPYSDLFTNPA